MSSEFSSSRLLSDAPEIFLSHRAYARRLLGITPGSGVER